MANIILRTNIANKNFTVEHKVLKIPISKSTVELIISPKTGYIMKASDMVTGFLNKDFIKNISYIDSGKKIKAVVSLQAEEINKSKSNINISLPINGKTHVLEDDFTLVESCEGDENGNVIISDSSSYSPIVNNPQDYASCCCGSRTENTTVKKYTIKNKPGNKVLVLSKKFITPENYYFTKEPNYEITGNTTRYTIISETKKDKKQRLTYKSFDVYYTSPNETTPTKNEDTICFSSQTTSVLDKFLEEGKDIKDRKPREKKENKIYSFDTTRSSTAKGGIEKVEVKGVPGTPFKIMSQNEAKQTYNFKTATFEAGGGMLTGIIPNPRPGLNHGIYTTYIKINRSSSNDTVTTRLISDNVVNHDLIKSAKIESEKRSLKKENKIIPNSSLVFTFNSESSAFTIPSDSPITIGPGRYQEPWKSEVIPLEIKLFPADLTKTIRIIRQPIHNADAVFHAWDSAYSGDTTRSYDSDGNAILTDWDVSGDGNAVVNSEYKYIVQATAAGGGRVVYNDTDGDSYQFVTLKVSVSGVVFGTANVTPELKLKNFLEII
jgi:hypothetical protein